MEANTTGGRWSGTAALTIQAAEGKAFFAYFPLDSGWVSWPLKPQGTVTQPNNVLQVFSYVWSAWHFCAQSTSLLSPEPLFSLI
jgi:hypothetical protein